MSSYNNIQKIKYTKTPADIVSLHEYIIFEDTRAKEKYVVFKFSNNLNQRLFEFQFEVLQYNRDNELIEKSVVSHSGFVAEANDLFVPGAKLKVNFECQSLEIKLESAKFDRVLWKNGEFSDNSYRFDEYAENKKASDTAPVTELKKKTKEKTKKKKQSQTGFNIRNIFRRNKAVFPAVFNVILAVLFIGLIIGSTFYFKGVTGAFVIDDFVVRENSPGYVTILNYGGTEEEMTVPYKLGNYSVSTIAEGAFKSSGVKRVEFTTGALVIETGAFKNCSALTEVIGSSECGKITVMEGAFKNCSSLSTFSVDTAWLSRKCFDGTDNIKVLRFDRVVYYNDPEAKLLDIFNALKGITLTSLVFDYSTVADYSLFLAGIYNN